VRKDCGMLDHLEIQCRDLDTSATFYDTFLAPLGEPKLWPEYHPNYFGGFVRDPDGNNVEAVCHKPE
jgi:hypothetical protein